MEIENSDMRVADPKEISENDWKCSVCNRTFPSQTQGDMHLRIYWNHSIYQPAYINKLNGKG